MPIEVECASTAAGWRCDVTVDVSGTLTRHTVQVSRADLERWGGGRPVEDLVRRSFDFLLEREPATSILRSFELSAIQRYFPEFDQDFRR
jgi:hypothetical protein